MWVRSARGEGMHQAAVVARSACRLESLDADRDAGDAPCAGPHPRVRLTHIKPLGCRRRANRLSSPARVGRRNSRNRFRNRGPQGRDFWLPPAQLAGTLFPPPPD